MMIYPPIAELLKKVDSRYSLAMIVAKRARQLTAGSERRTVVDTNKNVTVAVQEIFEDKVKYERIKESIK